MAFQPIEIVIRARDEASKALETLRGRIAAIGTISIGAAVGQAITYLIGLVREMAQEFVRANLEIDGARRALNAIYKDAGLAERQLAFLRETASQRSNRRKNSPRSAISSLKPGKMPIASGNASTCGPLNPITR